MPLIKQLLALVESIKVHNTDGLEGKKTLLVFPGTELGGAERQGMHLARYLKRRGCHIHVWSTLPGEGWLVEDCACEGIPWATHRFLWPCRKSSLVRDGWRLIRALRKVRPDVILSYTTSPNVGFGLVWRFTPADVCIWGQRSTGDLRGDWVERLAFRCVSAVICNAAHEKEYLKEALGETTAPLHVIHNGLELMPQEKSRQAWRTELNIDSDAMVAVMLANFRPQKDHSTLLHAWALVQRDANPDQSRLCLVLAGAPQFTFAEVKHLAEDLNIIDTVRFPGHIRDVSGLLAACDIGVLISKREGLPNAILEYMTAGLPVIATDLPGNREALGGDVTGSLCKPSDPYDLAVRLQRFVMNHDKRLTDGERNCQRAKDMFSIQSMCEKTTHIISDLLNRKGQTADH